MKQKSILIVEDDAIIAIHMQNILTDLGYRVIGPVATGEAAISAESSDLVLMDIKLAGEMDGISAAQHIRSNNDIPIIFLTSYHQNHLVQQAKATAPYGYLIKPVAQRELAATIEMAFNRHMLDIQIKKGKTALQKAHDDLELRVSERTTALIKANEHLTLEIDKHRQTEEALLESKSKYMAVVNNIPGMIYTAGSDWSAEIISGSEAICGYSEKEINSREGNWLKIIHPDDRDRVLKEGSELTSVPKNLIQEYRIVNKTGNTRWVEDRKASLFSENGKFLGIDGIVYDITERKRGEEQLSSSKATLALIFDGISDPLIMVNTEMRVIRLNKAAKNYFGLTFYEEAVGKDFPKILKGDANPFEKFKQSFSESNDFPKSYERQGIKDASRLEQVFVDVVRSETGTPKAYIIRIADITEARAIERQLIQGEKLASLGLMIAGIAHEINNPNNFIYFNAPILRTYLQFILPFVDEYASTHPELEAFGKPYSAFREDCFKILENIEHGSTRINQIVGNLREFVRERGDGDKHQIDLKQVVEKGISICLGRIKKTVKTFTANIPENLPPIHSDPLAIEQIVVNLLINASQAADKDDSEVCLTITDSEDDKEVLVEVSDNGSGMESETLRKIFDPFFTTKAVGVGTGLGLSICHRLVAELRGRIEVQSEVDKGSVFRVILPKK